MILLSEYASKLLGITLKPEQRSLCDYLESAFNNRLQRRTQGVLFAPAQCGLSVILEIAYPAWIVGRDPLHRIGFATYSDLHSRARSRWILNSLNSPEHAEMFRDYKRVLGTTREWNTPARLGLNDGQVTSRALSIHGGMVGMTCDTLIQTDRFRSENECHNERAVRSVELFQLAYASSRLGEKSNNFIAARDWECPPSAEYLKGFTDWHWKQARAA